MKKALAGTLLAILTLIFTTALGLAVIQLTDLPYIIDVDLLNISENTGLPRSEIMANYSAMMDYLSPFSEAEFALPTLSHSQKADFHFAEVKTLFKNAYLLGFVSALFLAILFIKNSVSKRVLRLSGAITLTLPAVIGIFALTNFDSAFLLFHKSFFETNTWLFDSKLDSIINILPATFFMHCVILIMMFWIGCAVAQIIIGNYMKKSRNI